MSTNYKIEKNIPITNIGSYKRKHEYAFLKELEIGDSFLIDGELKDTMRLTSCCRRLGFNTSQRKISSNQYRLWRIK